MTTSSWPTSWRAWTRWNLAVLPVTGVSWSDRGQPRRVLAMLARLGIEPAWAGCAARLT
jgi:hypothetical protein